MSQGLRESLLTYQLSKTERTFAASSSTDSLPSPHGSERSHNTHVAYRARPTLRIRPHSSDKRAKERIRVQLIEEGRNGRLVSNNGHGSRGLRRTQSSQNAGNQALPNPRASLDKDMIQGDTSEITSVSSDVHETSSPSSLGTGRASRPSWSRTRSGGVWYRKTTLSQDNDSARSGASNRLKSDLDEPSPINVVPLKPPPRPPTPDTSLTNQIVVEIPFGYHRDSKTSFRTKHADRSADKIRRPSIDVKRVFSTSLTFFRRSFRDKPIWAPPTSPAQTRISRSPRDATSHRPFLRRNQTASNLERVSSLLEAQRSSNSKGAVRSLTYKSFTNNSSLDAFDAKQSRTKALIGTFPVMRKRSIERIADNTSSILNIHRGSTPQNSPTEESTYKIKRSPSAETEEFLKIDISIRGGTSYLASEARRISTPPLPSTGESRSQRGFFFDYTAKSNDFCDELGSMHLKDHTLDHARPDQLPSAKLGGTGPMKPDKVQRSSSRKMVSKSKIDNWYEAQLADLDTTSSSIDLTTAPDPERPRCRHECQARLAEIRRMEHEARLDYNIPEHLPSSPLCPRNPGYWRVREQKGSQFRGCWMHGFGEYIAVPGLMHS